MTRRFDPATMGFMNDAGLWLPTMTLWQREMVRFFRQRNRVVGAMATPLVFWLLLGFGFQGAFVIRGSDINYLAYFFPGTVVLVIMFTAIFSTISVIEDRREGFLQGVMVAPMPRLSLVLGKVLGGASIATIQGVLFLLLWPLVGSWPGWAATAAAVGVMFGRRLSRDHEPGPDADVVPLRRDVSRRQRTVLAGLGDARQSTDLRARGLRGCPQR